MPDNRETIQLRLLPNDHEKVVSAADSRSIPLSTLAKGVLLYAIEHGILDQIPDAAFLVKRGGRPRKQKAV